MSSCLGMSITALACAIILATADGLADKGLKENTLFIRNHKIDLPSVLRIKRISNVVSFAAQAGRRAVQKVLQGSKQLSDQKHYRRHVKRGGFTRAKADFEALKPINVYKETLTSGAQVMSGKVGDRTVYLTSKGNLGLPVMMIGKQYYPEDVGKAAAPHWDQITYFK